MARPKRMNCTFQLLLVLGILLALVKTSQGFYCRASIKYGDFNRRFRGVAYKYLTCNNITTQKGHPFTIDNRNYIFRHIIFKNSSVLELPPEVFKKYQDLTMIYLNDSKMEKINAEAFKVLPHVKALYLQNNKLTEIANNTFSHLPNLRILNLSKNSFFTIESISFNGLTSLEQLYLSGNYLTKIPSKAFASMPSLRILDLSFNRLYEVLDLSFSELFNLEKLFLGYNFLIHLSGNVFKNAASLHHLDVSFNQLETINFAMLPDTLEVLHINHNKFRNAKNWKRLENVAKIDLSQNRFSDILIGEGVTSLNAHDNAIVMIGRFVFAEAGDLITLNLSRNVIQRVDENSFRNLTSLERLDLSFNELKNLTVGTFKNLASLWELRLSSNLLASLDYGTFAGLDNLTMLFLDNNKLKLVHENSFYVLAKLRALYLMNNVISSLNALELISHVSQLNTFMFYGNRWKCNSLFGVIKTLSHNGIGFRNGSDYFVQNIHGIACTNGEYDFDEYDAEYQQEEPSTERAENKNSKHFSLIPKFLRKANSFKAKLLKYLRKFSNDEQANLTKTVNADYDEPKNSSVSDNDIPTFDRLVSDSYEADSETQRFLMFANKITACTLLNAALLFIMVLLFIFVMFRKNRRL